MSKLMAVILLAGFIVSNDDADKCINDGEDRYSECTHDDLVNINNYREPQRKKKQNVDPGAVNIVSKEWKDYQDNPVTSDNDAQRKRKIEERSYSHIECDQAKVDNKEYPFNLPLPEGWLYDIFGNTGRMRYFFDTSVNEYWVLPNVYCNKHNMLTAVSWMRSHEKMSHNDNDKMHFRFRDSRPPLYRGMNLENYHHKDRGGVYCDWRGWLHNPEGSGKDYQMHFRRLFDTNKGKEQFTFVNVYCHSDKTVRFFAKAVGGDSTQKDLNYPFEHLHDIKLDKEARDFPYTRCNWTGWLFGDMTAKTWKDPGDKDKRKHSYEKYYATDYRADLLKKPWMNGRVINPFCSREEEGTYGYVTALRVYCFYTPGSEVGKVDNNRCSDLRQTK